MREQFQLLNLRAVERPDHIETHRVSLVNSVRGVLPDQSDILLPSEGLAAGPKRWQALRHLGEPIQAADCEPKPKVHPAQLVLFASRLSLRYNTSTLPETATGPQDLNYVAEVQTLFSLATA